MEKKNYIRIVPPQLEGSEINTESTTELPDLTAANALFEVARRRLLHVNEWHDISGHALAHFRLTNELGQQITGEVKEGYYFQIDIPGPGTEAGEGFDWVVVEKIDHFTLPDAVGVALRVRPSTNPTAQNEGTAHFYSEESTSTFVVARENLRVIAAVYDRNTKANTDAESLIDNARNLVTGWVGKMIFSKIQWKSLTDGLLNL
jgi:hypothetical protein